MINTSFQIFVLKTKGFPILRSCWGGSCAMQVMHYVHLILKNMEENMDY